MTTNGSGPTFANQPGLPDSLSTFPALLRRAGYFTRTFEDKLEGRPEALRQAEMTIADMTDFRERGVTESLPREERKRKNLEALVKNYYRVLLSVDERRRFGRSEPGSDGKKGQFGTALVRSAQFRGCLPA